MAAEDLQWLTEKHYLVCPKGAMFKQMKVTSQNQVTFSGNKVATTGDTMKANVFICLGSMAFAAGAIAGLLVAALALLAVPVAGWALALIIGAALLLAIGAGYLKCKTNAAARIWVNSSPNLIIHNKEGLVVGQSQLSCPPENALIDIKETFWEAMMSTTMNNVGHIANFAFGFLAGRGMGSMAGTLGTQGVRAAGAEFLTIARTEMGAMFNPASLFGKMGWFCRSMRGLGMFGAYKGQYDIWSSDEMSVSDKLLASGQELVLAIFAAKGASLVCFPAGTEVHTGNGLMFIEDIAVGTMVWTVNEANGQRELKPITQTHRRTTLSMMVVELENGTIFEVTPEHRFLVNEEWKEIQSISVLDKLELVDGEKITVKNIGFISKSAVVYNFDVLDNENYFVTEDGVLVHNGYSGRRPKNPEHPVLDKDGNITEYGKWYYNRPGWRNKTVDDVWDNAKNENGKVIDRISEQEINWDRSKPRGDQWHMGHDYGYEFSKHQQSAAARNIGVKDFRSEYNTSQHISPELPSSNTSHVGEAPADTYFGF
ncbi:polymorphic toxin-type HINT domain-containing protein [Pedobacter sp. GR22-10]|uniref:polymorphic toxin-type HINT domain-containing protein n=1 Tax=Pedobacter sp. GR22-10 TaxID=2994472 RepID=UPI002246AC15|nr:polymorphic toxin-type HINT domain-containing protein [Pedobacter sp. GR22-10]MCX2429422.1 polymorphic toxin-type HINT domain-containing protein [Pedobacter sp. GR22-10]